MAGSDVRALQVGDLRVTDLEKRFGAFVAVAGLTLTIPRGSFFALLGPSGCGKTTTLRMIAGLEEPSAGTIHLGEVDVTHHKPYHRPVNTVFQSYALFPHLDVFENVAFGLRRRRVRDVERQVWQILELVQMEHLARRRPGQLSGGQQQRIALARALVNQPQVLLLDEPLGSLDLKLRRQMQTELKRIQHEVGLTFVHVTHDQEEAMTMADTVAVMNHGRIEQIGAPIELYQSPRTAFVANFLGQSNLVPGRRLAGTGIRLAPVECYQQVVALPYDRIMTSSETVMVGVRPEKVRLLPGGSDVPAGLNRFHGGRIVDASFFGVSTQYLVTMPWGQDLTVFSQNTGQDGPVPVGTMVTLAWEPEHTFGLSGDDLAGTELNDRARVPSR
jgi:spermidine/putrescine transport system ATP-binding protein